MEPDRYQENHTHYIIGIVALIGCLVLFAFSAYLVPFLALDWHYVMPDFVASFMHALRTDFNLGRGLSAWVIFSVFFIPGLLLAIIADILSNRIDNKIHGIEPEKKLAKAKPIVEQDESKGFIFRIICIVILVFIAARLFQWAISTTPV